MPAGTTRSRSASKAGGIGPASSSTASRTSSRVRVVRGRSSKDAHRLHGPVRFAGVNTVSDRGMTIAFALPRPMRHRRIRKVEDIAPGWFGHWMRITSPEQLDDELLGWLRESYHQMGMQERLK